MVGRWADGKVQFKSSLTEAVVEGANFKAPLSEGVQGICKLHAPGDPLRPVKAPLCLNRLCIHTVVPVVASHVEEGRRRASHLQVFGSKKKSPFLFPRSNLITMWKNPETVKMSEFNSLLCHLSICDLLLVAKPVWTQVFFLTAKWILM